MNVNNLSETTAFLKRQRIDYIPKKFNVLTTDQVSKFVHEVLDNF